MVFLLPPMVECCSCLGSESWAGKRDATGDAGRRLPLKLGPKPIHDGRVDLRDNINIEVGTVQTNEPQNKHRSQ